MTEADGVTQAMLPNEARLRNLTYSAPLYVDINKRTIAFRQGGAQMEETASEESYAKVFIGKVYH
jgi:DNA-directed RNA polymerase II subunit RPB2